MADYRLSAQVIGRSNGRSAVAASAYRAGVQMADERTGERHDYTRKTGIEHSEIMAPDNAPDWMHDRAQLWNAVEKTERRKDAQLARAIQLSLPHELTTDQRKALVRAFVQAELVERGMIADLAIHQPNTAGDERNHHAHVMLTMRELTADGFGKKERGWNGDETLKHWRESWASYQNRALERHGHSARVDHRSFEAQGIDREPSHHLGPIASDMERRGKPSRIGDENHGIANDNRDRAALHYEAAKLASDIAREKWKLGQWAERKRTELKAAHDLSALDLSRKHDGQKLALKDSLRRDNGTAKATLRAEVEAIEKRLACSGFRKILRDFSGRTETDHQTRQQMTASLADIGKREAERRQVLAVQQAADRDQVKAWQAQNLAKLEKGIERTRKRREATEWNPEYIGAPKPEKRATGQMRGKFEPSRKPASSLRPEPSPAPTPKGEAPRAHSRPQPQPEPLDKPSLADKKRVTDSTLSRAADKGRLSRPWESSAGRSAGNDRPWEGKGERPWENGHGRERKPD